MVKLSSVEQGLRHPTKLLHFVLRYPASVASSRTYLGTNIFERDWDICIILDTCRVDALRAVANDYPFLDGVNSITSVGGSSPEWIAATFHRNWLKKISNTAYLASNGYAHVILENRARIDETIPDELNVSLPNSFEWVGTDWDFVDASDLGYLEHIWEYEPKGKSGELGHAEGHSPPRYVTDRAIEVTRNDDFDRLVLHYNQPHSPYTARAIKEGRSLQEHEKQPFEYLRRTGDRKTVYEAYLNELRYVLDDVGLLLNNVNADRVVITADHGEAFGEYEIYAHTVGSLHPAVRKVPWAVTSGTDNESYTPQFEPINASKRSVTQTLEALGYKT